MNESITLPDGRQLSWDEFSLLSESEQNALFKPGKTKEEVPSNDGSDFKINRKELLPRIRAAAERNKLTEEDLLSFIKIMHDIFFPPVPSGGNGYVAEPRPKQRGHGKPFAPKPVMTPAGRFESIADATRHYGVDAGRIRAWIKRGKEGYYFL